MYCEIWDNTYFMFFEWEKIFGDYYIIFQCFVTQFCLGDRVLILDRGLLEPGRYVLVPL